MFRTSFPFTCLVLITMPGIPVHADVNVAEWNLKAGVQFDPPYPMPGTQDVSRFTVVQMPFQAAHQAEVPPMTSSAAYDFWLDGDEGSLLITMNEHAECGESERTYVNCDGRIVLTHSTDLLVTVAVTYNYDLRGDYTFAGMGANISVHSVCSDPYDYWCRRYWGARSISTIDGPVAGTWTLSGQAYVPAGEPFLLGYGASISSSGDAHPGLGFGDGTILFTIQPAPQHTKGDANCDGAVTHEDISEFILGILNPDGYRLAHPECDPAMLDMNDDGVVDGADIQGFIDALLVP